LYKAALDGANLGGADLSWTGLSGADLRDAMLSGADLQYAKAVVNEIGAPLRCLLLCIAP
jgi:uncharacterized protein YjbI with pentapeptide repeats